MNRMAVLWLALAVVSGGCERESRHYDAPPSAADATQVAASVAIHAGPSASGPASSAAPDVARRPGSLQPPDPKVEQNAVAVAEGKRLYRWYNCNGCHAAGGGSMGPALMDGKWIYVHEPQQIVASILQGRPNGMPSFSARIPEDQVWKLAAYVRSMSGQLSSDVAPSRSDSLSAGPPEQRRKRETPVPSIPGKDH